MYISKTKLVLTGILAASLIVIVTAYSQNRLLQGQQPYTPTQLEWLVVTLNSQNPLKDVAGDGFAIIYHPDLHHGNTIEIHCFYLPDKADKKYMNESIQASRKLAMQYAKIKGWGSWLKIKEIIAPSPQ